MEQPFEDAVTQHGSRVLRVCRGLLGVQDAEDAWQTTFLKALRAWPGLAPETPVEAWLVTIAHRTCLDHRRAAARDLSVAVAQPPEVAVHDPERSIWGLVAELPARQRGAVTLRHLGGMSYAEVAGLLGGTEAAARRAAADGMRTLRARLTEGESDG